MQKGNRIVTILMLTLATVNVVVLGLLLFNNGGGQVALQSGNPFGNAAVLSEDALLAQVSQFNDDPPTIMSFTARQIGSTYFYSPFVAVGSVPVVDAKISINGVQVDGLKFIAPYTYSATGYPVYTAGVLQGMNMSRAVARVGDKVTLVVTDGAGKQATKTITCRNLGRSAYCY